VWIPRVRARRFVAQLLLAVSVCVSGTLAATQTLNLTEYEIKAGFLFNFTKFVEWPADAFADSRTPLVLGVVGENPFGNLLIEAAAGKTVNGRQVLVREFKEDQDLRRCHVLFISSTDKKRVAYILGKLKGSSVLTVGEGSGFTQSGGMIAYLVEGNKVRLQIDLQAAAEAHLKISAKVIAVAQLVNHGDAGRE
jgi:hypothetical protein